MKLIITAAAAIIGLAAAFGPAGTAPAASLPDGTPVIEAGGRHSGGYRSNNRRGGREFGRRGGGREYGQRGGGRRYGHRRGGRGYARGYGHRRHGHGHDAGPYILGGVAIGTFFFLNALEDH